MFYVQSATPKKRKGDNLSRRTTISRVMRYIKARRSCKQARENNADMRVRVKQVRESQSQEARDERNQQRQLERKETRRFTVDRRRGIDQQRQQVHRALTSDSFIRLAFQYEPDVEYYTHSKVDIVTLEKECPHCHALKLKNEPVWMCSSSEEVQITEIETPPEPLHGLLIGTDPDSSLFLKSISTFNSCFQMTSFGATEIVNNIAANGQQFNSTFKIKGQVYHKVGSLLPMPNESHKFLQIYFMGGEDSERALANRVDACCDYHNLNSPFARRIISELDALLNEYNELLKLFKPHIPKLQSDNHAIVINPDRTPAGEHIGRFNGPVVDDVAGIMVGDRTATRQIVIRRKNNDLQFMSDTHRSYDALQYPLMF